MAETHPMWTTHTCNGKPTHHCAACWAEAYSPDQATLQENLRRLGYYERRNHVNQPGSSHLRR